MVKNRITALRWQIPKILGATGRNDGREEVGRTVVDHMAKRVGGLEVQPVCHPVLQLGLQSVVGGCSPGHEANDEALIEASCFIRRNNRVHSLQSSQRQLPWLSCAVLEVLATRITPGQE